jgi:hypothetical protein
MPPLWHELVGWEFDALRSLPGDEARAVWNSAFRKAWRPFCSTPLGRRTLMQMMLCMLPCLVAVWVLTGMFGWGIWARLAAEVGVHVLLYRPYDRMFRTLQFAYFVPYLRPFLHDELLLHVREFSSTQASSLWDAMTRARTETNTNLPV